MHKHKISTISVFFIVPKFTPQAKNLTICDDASAFARKFQERFADHGVADVMVELSGEHNVRISMNLHRYAFGAGVGEFGFFTERGLDMHFDNFYKRFPFDK